MREILFKAKRLDNGEWVEGYYMRHENRMLAPMGDTLKDEDVDHISCLVDLQTGICEEHQICQG